MSEATLSVDDYNQPAFGPNADRGRAASPSVTRYVKALCLLAATPITPLGVGAHLVFRAYQML